MKIRSKGSRYVRKFENIDIWHLRNTGDVFLKIPCTINQSFFKLKALQPGRLSCAWTGWSAVHQTTCPVYRERKWSSEKRVFLERQSTLSNQKSWEFIK